ncbi:MAG: hypothetical protein ACLFTZ_03245 [Acholeplasmataceae bacterium]
MFKWIGRILYIVVVFILTIQIYSFAYFTKLQNYYDDTIADRVDDDIAYMEGLNTLMGIDYFRMSPTLYEYSGEASDDDSSYRVDLSVYAVGATSEEEAFDGYAILANNVAIVEHGETVEDPIIRITVELDRPTLMVDEELSDRGSVFYNPSEPFAYYNIPVLFLFDTDNYLRDPDTEEIAVLERIEVNYSSGETDDDGNFIFSDEPLFIASTSAIDEAALGDLKDPNLTIDPDIYRIRDDFEDQMPSDADVEELNLNTSRNDLSAYNGVVWLTMGIYTLIIAILTYLVFFHRRIREYIRTKNEPERPVSSNESLFRD